MELEHGVQVAGGTDAERLHEVVVAGDRADGEWDGCFPGAAGAAAAVFEPPEIAAFPIEQM